MKPRTKHRPSVWWWPATKLTSQSDQPNGFIALGGSALVHPLRRRIASFAWCSPALYSESCFLRILRDAGTFLTSLE